MLRFVLDVIDVARVLRNVSEWILEIAEDVVAGAMTPRSPGRLDAVSSKICESPHHFVYSGDQVCHVIDRRMWRSVKRDVVMFRFGPEKRHLLAAPIGYAKTQGFRVERGDPLQIRCVVHNVADRPRLDAFLSPSVGMIRDLCRQFDTAALRIEESQAESSARLFER